MKIEDIYQCYLQCTIVSTDTRKIGPNSLFVALKGDNFDANTFAEEAISKGASFVIIDDNKYYTDKVKMILVSNSLLALQELASYHRQQLGLQIIALTGSNGKTTTKELINVVLSKKYNTIATIGNLNNHIGVPLTLLSLKNDTDIGIVEMGANHQKEIEHLCKIANPDFGYITNFGKAHLEGFGGVEGVIKGKSEMFAFLKEHHKTVFINLDDPIQKDKSIGINCFSFSTNDASDVKIKSISASPMVKIIFGNTEIQSNLIGLYNANNINAAITIGKYFNVSDDDIKSAIESYIPDNNRSQLIDKGSNKIILDAYNANPSSMLAAITNLNQLSETKKIAIIGDMFELGKESKIEHLKIVNEIASLPSLTTYFVGDLFFENETKINNCMFFQDFEGLSNYLQSQNLVNSTILIKGSRGMALERALSFL
jgi:UDP-N-acetylmuramoyl-tripeptide--D-alanyl-D-alanine ligase